MSLAESEIKRISIAAQLHDIGKIGIPDIVLMKDPVTLTPDEMVEYRKHPVLGQSAVDAIEGLRDAGILIRHHHELFDGSGFHDRLAGNPIPIGSRIITIADIFDRTAVIGSGRLAVSKALSIIESLLNRQYDPSLFGHVREIAKDKTISFAVTDGDVEMELTPKELLPGMLVSKDVKTGTGLLLLTRGVILDDKHIDVISMIRMASGARTFALNKNSIPWDDDELRNVVFDAINRHRVVESIKHSDEYALCSLAQTIELKDAYTKGHCDRVEEYALAIADVLGLEDTLKEYIKQGSWLHDCGKIGVPEAILNFNGPLSDEQMDIVKKHPCWGADVARLAHLSEPVVNIILYHHEHYDGTGYPIGLKGDKIPLEARIVNVADIFDALTSERPYRRKMPRERAMEILIENRGTYSDPRIIDIFVDLLKQEKVK